MQEPAITRVDVGDVALAVHAWPGAGDPILLLHATGFHSRCWNEVVRHLPGRQVYAVDLRFHGASGATGEVSWGLMAQDIQRLIAQLGLRRVIGVGHSIGGHLLARAAAREPQCFRHLVLIDPVILSPELYAGFQRGPALPGGEEHPVSRRRNDWQDGEEMYQRFKDREPFRGWRPAVLRDYCEHALRPAAPGEARRLACNPLHEARIYLRQRGNEVVLDELPRITVPVTLLRAPPDDADPFSLQASPTWPRLAAALPDCTEVYLPQLNHFIPMQDPELVATYILSAT